ncbi:DUF58 domain-containing protein [Phototrophicus methaneseepsis]|uniref:DUF58 domain-containing protein n=1 Tax=Phototrophicus methaneseepsis TaxID=2710758 RepID=A0A7S8IDA4_9CHLR|nr:DUF58 domain-containing protein [Phototrophicus methaneseepsis]QPC81164.1 DUF58 domain-containing protein [Phototrophicus methaneseepsis]
MPNRRNAIYLTAIITLIAGLFTGQAIFFTMVYVLAGIMLLSAVWAWFAVRGIRIARHTRTRRSQVGRPFSEGFTIRNTGVLPKLWLEVRDFSTMPGYHASQVVPAIWPRNAYQWQTETICTRRGEFYLGPLTITSGDPFGLFSLPRHIDARERIVVYPAIVPVTNVELPIGLLTGGEAQHFLTHNVTTNAAGVREYVPGDTINRIHWKTTARRNKLMVKEFELDPMVDIWLFADFSTQSLVEDIRMRYMSETFYTQTSSQTIPPTTEEYSVVVAASLARYFVQLERALGFSAYLPHREIYQPERGHRQLTRILEALAVAHNKSERTLQEMLALEAHSFARGTTLVLVTSSLDPSWLQEAQILARRGIRLLCIFIDPSSFDPSLDSSEIRGTMQLAKIPYIRIQKDDDITQALAQRPTI